MSRVENTLYNERKLYTKEELLMKIFKKEISKKTVKLFIGGVAVAIVGTTIMGVVIHNSKEPEGQADVEVIEIELEDDSVEE